MNFNGYLICCIAWALAVAMAGLAGAKTQKSGLPSIGQAACIINWLA
jgi:hypothetical protein